MGLYGFLPDINDCETLDSLAHHAGLEQDRQWGAEEESILFLDDAYGPEGCLFEEREADFVI